MTVKHPDDYEREDRREGCPSWDVTIPVTLTVRGRNAADAVMVAREALKETDVPMDIDLSDAEADRHDEY